MGISPSKFGAYASPVKGTPPRGSANHTPSKHAIDFSPLKESEGRPTGSTDVANFFDSSLSTFKPLETPSTWAFKWTTPRNLDYLESLLKANCRFLARYERVGENVLMHLPFCVRADTLKRKLADHLHNISFSHVSADGLDERDVFDVILRNLGMTGATSNRWVRWKCTHTNIWQLFYTILSIPLFYISTFFPLDLSFILPFFGIDHVFIPKWRIVSVPAFY